MFENEIATYVETVSTEVGLIGLSSAEVEGGFVILAVFNDETTVVVEAVS